MPRMIYRTLAIALPCLLVPAWAQDPAPKKQPELPGMQATGFVLLPNQWSLKPAGKQLELGDFPVNMALHPTGNWLAILHAGYGEHEIVIVDLRNKKQKIQNRVALEQTFIGLGFTPDGTRLFASGGEFEVVHVFDFAEGFLTKPKKIAVVPPKEKFVVGGIASDAASKTLYVAGPFGDAIYGIPIEEPEKKVRMATGKGSYPYTCLPHPDGKSLFVSLWDNSCVAVIDLATKEVAARWGTDSHPTEMALSPDGKTLYVACANSTKVSVIDTTSGQGRETLACSLYPKAPSGNTPMSLCLTPDGRLLFVANADANNVAVFAIPEKASDSIKPLGFIPVGWYPTSIRYNPLDKQLYIANGKGTTPKANPQGPQPLAPSGATLRQYIAGLYHGTLSFMEIPDPKSLSELTKTAYACSPLKLGEVVSVTPPPNNPVPGKVGDPSPIKHCIYIIKENRTYDQVLGDMKAGNGDPNLCIFPEKVTPNHHKLSREFVLLDNFYVEGEVSADGHEWSMGAYATDFVEKVWPLTYRRGQGKLSYPAEGSGGTVAQPERGYLWDRAAEARISYRSYGEWIRNGKGANEPGYAMAKALEGHFDPWYRSYDLDYPDQKRADRFLEELARFEREGEMPRLIILRLPNDHTSGTRAGKPTPTAMVADNDLALGRLVEGVSKSKFWRETAIFVLEDDAQNGSDHVDAHRSVALVVSPYTKRGSVDSHMYSTSSMLRTIELILGLKPMSQFDAAARPMYWCFTDKPDYSVYTHAVPEVDLNQKNLASAWGAKLSETFDLTKEDAADDLLLNEVIWRSVKGAASPMPPPVRAAFVLPKVR